MNETEKPTLLHQCLRQCHFFRSACYCTISQSMWALLAGVADLRYFHDSCRHALSPCMTTACIDTTPAKTQSAESSHVKVLQPQLLSVAPPCSWHTFKKSLATIVRSCSYRDFALRSNDRLVYLMTVSNTENASSTSASAVPHRA